MAHTCHLTNCNVPVSRTAFACKKHWLMVPRPMRETIVRHYRIGQCDTLDPSAAYCRAARNAVIAVARQEGVEPDTRLYDMFEAMAVERARA